MRAGRTVSPPGDGGVPPGGRLDAARAQGDPGGARTAGNLRRAGHLLITRWDPQDDCVSYLETQVHNLQLLGRRIYTIGTAILHLLGRRFYSYGDAV